MTIESGMEWREDIWCSNPKWRSREHKILRDTLNLEHKRENKRFDVRRHEQGSDRGFNENHDVVEFQIPSI